MEIPKITRLPKRAKNPNPWIKHARGNQGTRIQRGKQRHRVMEDEATLYQQLQKLSSLVKPEEAVDQILSTLWKTRRTGLRPPEKSHIQSLLGLPSPSELDPVCQ